MHTRVYTVQCVYLCLLEGRPEGRHLVGLELENLLVSVDDLVIPPPLLDVNRDNLVLKSACDGRPICMMYDV